MQTLRTVEESRAQKRKWLPPAHIGKRRRNRHGCEAPLPGEGTVGLWQVTSPIRPRNPRLEDEDWMGNGQASLDWGLQIILERPREPGTWNVVSLPGPPPNKNQALHRPVLTLCGQIVKQILPFTCRSQPSTEAGKVQKCCVSAPRSPNTVPGLSWPQSPCWRAEEAGPGDLQTPSPL